jgi:hypothetical protein
MASAKRNLNLCVKEILAETCAHTLSDEPSDVLSESDDDDKVGS